MKNNILIIFALINKVKNHEKITSFFFIVLLSSCATILNGKFQKVEIKTNGEATVISEGDTTQFAENN